MKNAIRLTAMAAAVALSTTALAMGSKERKTEPSARTANSATGTSAANTTERTGKGEQASGLSAGQGTTTAEAAKQRGNEKGGTTDDNLGRQRADEKPAGSNSNR